MLRYEAIRGFFARDMPLKWLLYNVFILLSITRVDMYLDVHLDIGFSEHDSLYFLRPTYLSSD